MTKTVKTVKTIEVSDTPSIAALFFRALGTGVKHPGVVRSLPPVTLVLPKVELSAAHVERYAQLCGFDPAMGTPLLYPQLLTFPLVTAYMCSSHCPWPALGTVHLANSVVQQRRLVAGEQLRVELGAGHLFPHPKGQGFTLDLRILSAGEPVWTATQSLLRLGVKRSTGEAVSSPFDTTIPLSCQTEFNAFADIGRRYARVSGDHNPIHLTALTARLFGFRRAIAHGMWTQARALACLLPPAPLERASLAVEFKAPLFLPGRATLWSARHTHGAEFEVRDAKGQRPHLHGQFSYQAA